LLTVELRTIDAEALLHIVCDAAVGDVKTGFALILIVYAVPGDNELRHASVTDVNV
jgi:hypothetical protein